MQIRAYQPKDRDEVIALWRRCGLVHSENDPGKDIDRKLRVRPDLFLVGLLDNRLVAAVMAGYEGHRGWINYLGVDPDLHRRGLGREIVAEAERLLKLEGCAKINLQVRSTNKQVIRFYQRLGYSVDDVVSMGKRLEHDDPAGR